MKKQIKKGFTLAEVLITLTILGVIAAIVIPTMMRKNSESANRTKMKKAIASFEKVIETMRLTEGYTTVDAMKTDMNVDGCEKSRGYFKTKNVDSENGCIFQTNDGLWWNVTDITKPIVALEKGTDNKYIKNGTYATRTSSEDEGLKAFYMTVTQGTAAQGYAFIVNEASGDANKALAYAKLAEGKVDPYAAYSQECTCSMQDLFAAVDTLKSNNCSACTAKLKYDGYDVNGIFDANGNVVYFSSCKTGTQNCSSNSLTYEDNKLMMEVSCNSNECNTFTYKYNDNNTYEQHHVYQDPNYHVDGIFYAHDVAIYDTTTNKYLQQKSYYRCNENGTGCESSQNYVHGEYGTTHYYIELYDKNGNLTGYDDNRFYEYDNAGNQIAEYSKCPSIESKKGCTSCEGSGCQ